MRWTSAVARISVAGSRGTGFLVSASGLVLTAFHVVGDRARSRQLKRPQFYGGAIAVRFGDQRTWTTGDAVVVDNLYSFEDDWAVLQVPAPGPEHDVVPLELAKLREPRSQTPFATFGFPDLEQDTGGLYQGAFGVWSDDLDHTIEAPIANLPLAQKPGGISGAPCVVNDQVVAMILQALTDVQERAQKSSLYVAPIERVVRGWDGLVWDRGDAMAFEKAVIARLPTDPSMLIEAGAALGLSAARAQDRRAVARRMLSTPIRVAAAALASCQLTPDDARPILDHLGAMQLPPAAVTQLHDADRRRRPALVATQHGRLHRWYIQRAFADAVVSPRKIALVRLPPGDEELAAGDPVAAAVDDLIARLRVRLERKQNGALAIDRMLAAVRDDDYRFWAVLVGERRFDVLDALARRVPNARVIAGCDDEVEPPASQRELVVQVSPTMTSEEQLDRIALWETIVSDFDLPVEPDQDL